MATTTERTTAVGVFHDHASAQKAIRELRQMGFTESEIGVAGRDMESKNGDYDVDDKDDKVAGAATAGAITGGGIGALWGLGIAAGILPAIGPVIAGGTLAAILASTATGAAVAGITGALVGLGLPEDEARHYQSEFEAGRTIVTVKTNRDRCGQAQSVLDRHSTIASKYV